MKPRYAIDQNDRWVQMAPEKHYEPQTKKALNKIVGEEGFLDYPAMKEYYKKKKQVKCKTKGCKNIVTTNNKTVTCYTCKLKADKKRMKQLKQKKYSKL